MSAAQQSLVQGSAWAGRATCKNDCIGQEKKGKVQWEQQDLTKMERWFLSVAPFSYTLGVLMGSNGKSQHRVWGAPTCMRSVPGSGWVWILITME